MSKNIIIAIIVLMNLGLMYMLKEKNKLTKVQKEALNVSVNRLKTINANKNTGDSFIATKYWWELNSQAEVLPDVQLVSDLTENQRTVNLSELIGDRPKLVFRYSEIHCDVCVDSTMNSIMKFAEEIGRENILIISSYENPRDMYAFKRLNQIDLPLYNLKEQTLGITPERADTPYLFMVHPDRKVERVYLFYKEIASQTPKYFKILKNKYFIS